MHSIAKAFLSVCLSVDYVTVVEDRPILIVYRVLEAFSLNATLIFTLIIIIIIIIII